jgi:hypothetical protein
MTATPPMATTEPCRNLRSRAVTLVEAVLYVSVTLALIVGGLVFFQQASMAARTNAMVRQLSALLAETRVLIMGQPLTTLNANLNVSNTLDLTSYLIAAGAVPSEMISGPNSLRNPFGGTVALNAANLGSRGAVIIITTTAVPQVVCARLLTSSSGTTFLSSGTTPVGPGYILGGATPPPDFSWVDYIMNPSEAGVNCKYGVAAHTSEIATPTSAPLVGPVNVMMGFLVEY